MHIPDGYLSTPVLVGMDMVAAGVVAYGVKAVEKRLGERQVPALAVTAAFIFAAQMINVPVPGGTSGHLLGGVLAAILLGPWAAVLVMATVIATQCFLFGDGGITALGANVFNMGILSTIGGYAVFRAGSAVLGEGRRSTTVFLAAWVSTLLGALATALQLAASGTAAPALLLPTMLAVHAVIGVLEGAVTVAALSALSVTRPDLLRLERV